MRGLVDDLGLRLIPAHAGKTLAYFVRLSDIPAHPRSRGENRDLPRLIAPALGSSPLTRGKLWERRLDFLNVRLIPAHAGKTP